MSRRIPITAKEPFYFDDKESGVRYFIKPKTGRTDLKFSQVIDNFNNKSLLEKSDKICDLIDIFVCGWESLNKSVILPDFNQCLPLSECLDKNVILDLFDEILKINGLSQEEKKSSSQQQTSSSEIKNTEQTTTAETADIKPVEYEDVL